MISQETNQVSLIDAIAPSFYDMHWDIYDGLNTHYWLSGGRGSTKSSFVAVEMILGIMDDSLANGVAIRKIKETLKESVYEQLCWAIEVLEVEDYWHIGISPMQLVYKPTGQKIIFRGADIPKKVKSSKLRNGYFKYIWYEELDEFNGMEDIRIINQTFMRGGSKFNVFYSYNPPKSANSWVNTEVKLTRVDRYVHHSTYLTVPEEWLGKPFITEAEHLRDTKPQAYDHEYMGSVTGSGGEVFDNVQIRRISDEEIQDYHEIKRGLDFGYAVDPLSYNVMHYDRKHKRLYIFYEFYKVGVSNHLANEEIQKENKHNGLIIADSAEPKSIHELISYGRRMRGVKKGPDSIEYGIRFLQSLEAIIIDDTRCPETAREFLNYELARDVQGNWKAGYPDKDNHSIDSVRYALNDEWLKFRADKPKPKMQRDDLGIYKPKQDAFRGGKIDESYIQGGW